MERDQPRFPFGKLKQPRLQGESRAPPSSASCGQSLRRARALVQQILQLRTRTSTDHQALGSSPRGSQRRDRGLDRLPRGATSISDLSPHIEEAVERGWVYGTLMFGESQVRTATWSSAS